MAKPPRTEPRAAPLRLLHVHSSFDPGGKELRCVALINAFGPAVAHSIVSAVPGAMGAARHVARGIPVLRIGLPGLVGGPWPRRMEALARAMKGYDLILTYNWGAMNAVLAHTLFGKRHGLAPLIHHEDGFNSDEAAGLKPTRNWFRMLALARAQALVVPSRGLERIALDHWGQPPARVHRIANGVVTKAYAGKAARDALPRVIKHPGELWVGTFSGLRPVKHLTRLVRAFAALPEPWQLVIVGDGPDHDAIRAEAIRLDIGHRVHLPGFVANPAKVAGLFDLFALSSDSEQFPISVVEAMAAGLAVVSPAVGDIAEMVSAANRPFITPPGDEGALTAALADLAALPAERKRIGGENRARARAEYEFSDMVGRHAALYARAMGRAAFP
ncbi:glycosyltransferase [Novosphingobium tardum]|uniref:Glycosyltransferase n=1 Tax=Novosphingobium tardum TaxID=1538021 RepID=A0ABV8RTA7_9SPHN